MEYSEFKDRVNEVVSPLQETSQVLHGLSRLLQASLHCKDVDDEEVRAGLQFILRDKATQLGEIADRLDDWLLGRSAEVAAQETIGRG